MRDPNRIDTILNEVGSIWKENPDLRLGQLLLNAARDPLLYYLEDHELVDYLKATYKKGD